MCMSRTSWFALFFLFAPFLILLFSRRPSLEGTVQTTEGEPLAGAAVRFQGTRSAHGPTRRVISSCQRARAGLPRAGRVIVSARFQPKGRQGPSRLPACRRRITTRIPGSLLLPTRRGPPTAPTAIVKSIGSGPRARMPAPPPTPSSSPCSTAQTVPPRRGPPGTSAPNIPPARACASTVMRLLSRTRRSTMTFAP